MIVDLSRKFQFDSAHRNTAVDPSDRRARTHGHTYEATLIARGPLDDHLGWLMDFGDLKSIGNAAIDQLDHRCLNSIDGMTDTTIPDIVRWLQMRTTSRDERISLHWELEIVRYGVEESTVIRQSDGKFVVSLSIAAAHFLPQLPKAHKCRRLHGHSFHVELLTQNEAAIRDSMTNLYQELDHRLLNEISGLENPTSEILAHWLWQKVNGQSNHVVEICVSETCTTACRYRGE